MTNIDTIRNILKENGYITSKMLKDKKIDSWYLTELVKKKEIERVSRGVYIEKDGIFDEFFVFQYNNSKAIFSYTSALYFHNLTEYIPTEFEVSVYQGYNTHRFDKKVIVHYVKKEIYNLGLTEVKTRYGNPIKVYDKERTLCDLLIYRGSIDSEVFKVAYQSYFNDSSRDVLKLMEYARILNIELEMFSIIEVMN